ncbi:hypothetical protein [Gorillibacterium sp. sgz5001074]|uniref:hypothetical protein n=1 Tax=Gorillibacterium sp. sgz5001074 TaxID=3446695 RepID=UPI003F667BBA
MKWTLRLSVIGFCSAAMLLAPVTLTALGNETTESASSAPAITIAEGPAATSAPKQPAAAPNPGTGTHADTPAPASGRSAAASSPPETAQTAAHDPAMEEQIRQWVASLSKEKGFETWSQAKWDVYPLGPGTHGWVVVLRSSGQELGYLVIASMEDGTYKLTEYGTGETPLFSMETLYHSLVQRGLIDASMKYYTFLSQPPLKLQRWYVPPLQAVWQVETQEGSRYYDAKTGEELPDVTGWLEREKELSGSGLKESASSPSGGIASSAEWEAHDPFLRPTWLKGKPMAAPAFDRLQSKLSGPAAEVTYSGKWYDGIALYPLAVSGYHLWSGGEPYVRLEHNGPRYAAFPDTVRLGGYYSPPS